MPFTPSIKQNVFEFKVAASKKTWSIPLRQLIPVSIAERIEANGLRMSKHTAFVQEMRAAIASGEEVPDLPEDFDPEFLLELKAAQRALFDKYCPGLYDVANSAELNEIMQEWGRLSNIGLGE